MLVDVTHDDCKRANWDYYRCKLSYFVAVKRCLQTVVETEVEAIKICNDYHSYLVEGMDQQHLPSDCASRISKFL